VGRCGLTTDKLYGLILFSRHFKYLFSLCWRGERLTEIPRPKYDAATAGNWCLNIVRLSVGPSPFRTRALIPSRTCPQEKCKVFLWKRTAGSHPHYGQRPFAFIKAVSVLKRSRPLYIGNFYGKGQGNSWGLIFSGPDPLNFPRLFT